MKPSVLVFGASSLVGSHFVAAAASTYTVTAVGRTDPRSLGLEVGRFDALDLSVERAVRAYLSARSGDVAWVNFAARTDVDGCESERRQDPGTPGTATKRADSAWTMNAELPRWVGEEGKRSGTPLWHLSTDFVFDGTSGPYAEAETPSPFGPRVSWYGYTKGMGENALRSGSTHASILRISYPFRAEFPPKTDFARNLLERARSGTLYPLYSDQRITPTWIPDITDAVLAGINAGTTGVVHVASPEITTPLEFARSLLEAFGLGPVGLSEAQLARQPTQPGRAPRPIHGGLVVDSARTMGLSPLTANEALRRMASIGTHPA